MELLSPANAFSTQFEINNTGYLDASDIRPNWQINDAKINSARAKNATMFDVGIEADSVIIPRLKAGEKSIYPLNVNDFIGIEREPLPSSADITINASYKIRILPFLGVFKYSQRFVSITNNAGQVQWNAAPSN